MELTPTAALRQRGWTLPPPPAPVGSYAPAIREGDLLWVSGQGAMVEGAVLHPGRVPDTVSLEQAQEAARRATLQALSALAAEAGSLDRIRRIVRLTVFVASVPSFTRQHEVANAASEVLIALFGESGRSTRVAVGVVALPRDFPVEVDLVARRE